MLSAHSLTHGALMAVNLGRIFSDVNAVRALMLSAHSLTPGVILDADGNEQGQIIFKREAMTPGPFMLCIQRIQGAF